MRVALSFVLLSVCFAGCASGPWPRTSTTLDWTVCEVPWVELKPPQGRRPVSVFGVVHIADRAFFAEVQDATNRCGRVLVEGVMTHADGSASSPMARYSRAMTALSRTLQLVTQSEALVPRSWWQRADVGEAEFNAAGKTDIIASDMEREAALLERHSSRDLARAEFARGILAEHPDDRFLIQDRNKIVVQALAAEHGEGRIGILYGAHHVPDLVSRLEQLGYEVGRIKWVPTFSYRTPEDPYLRTGIGWRSW